MYSLYINSEAFTLDATGFPHGTTTSSLHFTCSDTAGTFFPIPFVECFPRGGLSIYCTTHTHRHTNFKYQFLSTNNKQQTTNYKQTHLSFLDLVHLSQRHFTQHHKPNRILPVRVAILRTLTHQIRKVYSLPKLHSFTMYLKCRLFISNTNTNIQIQRETCTIPCTQLLELPEELFSVPG